MVHIMHSVFICRVNPIDNYCFDNQQCVIYRVNQHSVNNSDMREGKDS